MKITNLKDLKDYLNTCNDKQLAGKALVQTGDDSGGEIVEIDTLEEDYFQSEEGIEPVRVFEEDEDTKLSDYKIVPAQTVYMHFKY